MACGKEMAAQLPAPGCAGVLSSACHWKTGTALSCCMGNSAPHCSQTLDSIWCRGSYNKSLNRPLWDNVYIEEACS